MTGKNCAQDTRDRVIRLETELENLKEQVIKPMAGKVDALHDMFTQAKGAKWAVRVFWAALIAVVSFFSTLMFAPKK